MAYCVQAQVRTMVNASILSPTFHTWSQHLPSFALLATAPAPPEELQEGSIREVAVFFISQGHSLHHH